MARDEAQRSRPSPYAVNHPAARLANNVTRLCMSHPVISTPRAEGFLLSDRQQRARLRQTESSHRDDTMNVDEVNNLAIRQSFYPIHSCPSIVERGRAISDLSW